VYQRARQIDYSICSLILDTVKMPHVEECGYSMTYESVRIALVQAIEAEMMGPGSECPMGFLDPMVAEHELISESPLQRYSVGLLYEQGTLRDPEDESAEGRSADERAEIDELLDIATTTANQYYPSSVGMSFYAERGTPARLSGRRSRVQWPFCHIDHAGYRLASLLCHRLPSPAVRCS
jgi:hypothetical protein